MTLPTIPQSSLPIVPIDWSGLDKRFLNPGELEVLVALVRVIAPKTMLEIGVNTGRTALALLRHVPSLEYYIGIDVLPGYVPAMAVQRNELPQDPGHFAKMDPRFKLILSAQGSLDFQVAKPGLPPCEVVFIDGDHGCAAVMHDTALARALVPAGGMIIWHDYHNLGTVEVKPTLDEYHHHGAAIFHVEGTWIAFERIVTGGAAGQTPASPTAGIG
jgi:predicted O-methyltransferase YrrM